MSEKIHLTKSYERDISLVQEDTWVKSFVESLEKKYNYKNPYQPLYFLNVTADNCEIWENDEAMKSFLDWLLEKNNQGPEFIREVITEYLPILEKIQSYWAKGRMTDKTALKEFLELSRDGVSLFALWYYSGVDERTPQNVRDQVMPLREKDEYFARNALFIRDSLVALGVKSELVNQVLPSEFPDVPSNDILQERAQTGIIAIDGKDYFFTSLKEFAQNHPEYEFEDLFTNVSGISELRGQVAFKGKVKGKVKILKNQAQMLEVSEGMVLVSPMTTPDFLPAMKKSIAFVTDEGGIMCHAAIVARELGKPCITGTKFATQIFKDGDMVEVDADNGVVRIMR